MQGLSLSDLVWQHGRLSSLPVRGPILWLSYYIIASQCLPRYKLECGALGNTGCRL